jgi:hypothetical protein
VADFSDGRRAVARAALARMQTKQRDISLKFLGQFSKLVNLLNQFRLRSKADNRKEDRFASLFID